MPKLLTVNANLAKRKVERGIRQTEAEDHAFQAIGDILLIREDNQPLTSTEQDIFDVIEIRGFSTLELETILNVPIRDFHNDPFKKEWLDESDGKWKQMVNKRKCRKSISNLSQGDINKLSRTNVSKQDKIAILQSTKNNVKDDPANQFEISIPT